MCFITHNKLIFIISCLAILQGIATFTTSVRIIQEDEILHKSTRHANFLIACTVFTIGSSVTQSISSVFFFCRKISVERWICTNAIVFIILMIGICVAMTKFSAVRRDRESKSSLFPTATSQIPKAEKCICEENDSGEEIENMKEQDQSIESTDDKNRNETEFGEFNSSVITRNAESKPLASNELKLELLLEIENTTGAQQSKESSPLQTEAELHSLLKLYFASILVNFLSLPIFLGLVASKADKFESFSKGDNRLLSDI